LIIKLGGQIELFTWSVIKQIIEFYSSAAPVKYTKH